MPDIPLTVVRTEPHRWEFQAHDGTGIAWRPDILAAERLVDELHRSCAPGDRLIVTWPNRRASGPGPIRGGRALYGEWPA